MEGVDRDIQEMKRLKKKQLVHYNFGMLLLMVLFAYFVRNGGSANLLLGLCCALFWIFAAGMLYTLKTGKVLGPKSSSVCKLLTEIDWERSGGSEKPRYRLFFSVC
ncbi:hypothetical protein SAMN04487936_11156 [Halobacillus dabanensis]|uniref:Uncharacterized protein n=1 Tax=Halobacillus dabanensis TaxID=240302 RepID=A0A1I3YK70_HALDA|nr:hypothetical protein [Halobacillus dabanensis]SFK32232.1 hypothetical protein SAMN04487936_11156 [Halobacillus dabanensis]